MASEPLFVHPFIYLRNEPPQMKPNKPNLGLQHFKLHFLTFPLFFHRMQPNLLRQHWLDVRPGAAPAQRGPNSVRVHPDVYRGRRQQRGYCPGESVRLSESGGSVASLQTCLQIKRYVKL